jgi:hypothetical protein
MHPLKLTVEGEFWDSQIYKGRLYLFSRDGSVTTINWDRLIGEWDLGVSVQLAKECAFRRSDYLYGDRWSLLFSDKEFRSLIESKFKQLASKELVVSSKQMRTASLGVQDNPFPFPHSDSTVYKERLYVTSQAGVFEGSCNKRTRFPISTKIYKMWDAPVVALAASYNSLALAASDEGLYELSVDRIPVAELAEPRIRANRNCVSCKWVFYSIYGSSHVAGGFLASFTKIDQGYNGNGRREAREVVSDREIFQSKGYSWGTQDKLCQAEHGKLKVVKYQPWLLADEPSEDDDYLSPAETNHSDIHRALQPLRELNLNGSRGKDLDVVSAGVAAFGTVVELADQLLVIPSDGPPVRFHPPVNWRVFPRSRHYENHLHLIYDDKLEVISFNHDYFVNQNEKISGFRFSMFRD